MRETALKKPYAGAHGVAKVRTVGGQASEVVVGRFRAAEAALARSMPNRSQAATPMNSVPTRASVTALPHMGG
ncbi:Hypothetical protein NGAL_HAMBI2427_53000 [Neorhizobium galegae bv. orientalis]|uniref:Uncharacterized protein n=1 Tax=Neorhizobium galegae bv. orientalis str. HAMBI 540 TaxID=1028800 RepID=A0A068SMD0_NEOGA|nr:Hypothetical protein RG540_CH08050 [Neorhizobium galegae bv. orientalis str. HAMBI 540]CDZ53723.1 Hypothetical protein NGAL_HAMBI2427_53000 [Neorhizobium galegae bv. orientalis]